MYISNKFLLYFWFPNYENALLTSLFSSWQVEHPLELNSVELQVVSDVYEAPKSGVLASLMGLMQGFHTTGIRHTQVGRRQHLTGMSFLRKVLANNFILESKVISKVRSLKCIVFFKFAYSVYLYIILLLYTILLLWFLCLFFPFISPLLFPSAYLVWDTRSLQSMLDGLLYFVGIYLRVSSD